MRYSPDVFTTTTKASCFLSWKFTASTATTRIILCLQTINPVPAAFWCKTWQTKDLAQHISIRFCDKATSDSMYVVTAVTRHQGVWNRYFSSQFSTEMTCKLSFDCIHLVLVLGVQCLLDYSQWRERFWQSSKKHGCYFLVTERRIKCHQLIEALERKRNLIQYLMPYD